MKFARIDYDCESQEPIDLVFCVFSWIIRLNFIYETAVAICAIFIKNWLNVCIDLTNKLTDECV